MLRPLLSFVLVISVVAGSAAIAQSPASPASGLHKGEEVTAWEPVHVAGPHAGTSTCPVCTYLDAPMLLAFAKDLPAAEALAKPLEGIADAHAPGKLRVMLVVLNASDDALLKFAIQNGIRQVMLCRPDVRLRAKQLAAYKIDTTATNTVMLYQNYIVQESWVDLGAADLPVLTMATAKFLPKR